MDGGFPSRTSYSPFHVLSATDYLSLLLIIVFVATLARGRETCLRSPLPPALRYEVSQLSNQKGSFLTKLDKSFHQPKGENMVVSTLIIIFGLFESLGFLHIN